jgi:hypothetical protein
LGTSSQRQRLMARPKEAGEGIAGSIGGEQPSNDGAVPDIPGVSVETVRGIPGTVVADGPALRRLADSFGDDGSKPGELEAYLQRVDPALLTQVTNKAGKPRGLRASVVPVMLRAPW